MTELTFAKSFLSTLDSRPLKLQSDYALNPRELSISSTYTLPKMSNAMHAPSSANAKAGTSTVTVVLKSARNPTLELTLPGVDAGTATILDLKDKVAKELGLDEAGRGKVKLLWERKPVSDAKSIREVMGDPGPGAERHLAGDPGPGAEKRLAGDPGPGAEKKLAGDPGPGAERHLAGDPGPGAEKKLAGDPGPGAEKKLAGDPGPGAEKKLAGDPGPGAEKRLAGDPGPGAEKKLAGDPGPGAERKLAGDPGPGAERRLAGDPGPGAERKLTGDPGPGAELTGDPGPGAERKVEFGVMIMGWKPSAAGTAGAAGVKDGAEDDMDIDTDEKAQITLDESFWVDLRGFLQQRLKNEEHAALVMESFKKSWEGP